MNENFDRVESALAELEKAEESYAASLRRKADWDDANARKEYVREYKRAHRIRLLDVLVKDRTCPLCKEMKVRSRQWVVLTAAEVVGLGLPPAPKHAICRSCWSRL